LCLQETVIDYRWYPGKFPATTIPPRAQSAGALGRSQSSQHGTVRDFSSLGKSTRSPFRNGETPVLPMNLVCRWPEYRVMEEGDVVLTVEHCCNCAEHELITHHKEEQYVQVSGAVRVSTIVNSLS
jgi:ferredoxin-like protein FixX